MPTLLADNRESVLLGETLAQQLIEMQDASASKGKDICVLYISVSPPKPSSLICKSTVALILNSALLYDMNVVLR